MISGDHCSLAYLMGIISLFLGITGEHALFLWITGLCLGITGGGTYPWVSLDYIFLGISGDHWHIFGEY